MIGSEGKMRDKTLTVDCVDCSKCNVDNNGNFMCSWGNGKPKRMVEAKGKQPLKCKLKRI